MSGRVAGRPYQYSSASYVRLAQIRRISRKLPSSLLCKRGARLRERADLTKYDEDGQRGSERENRRKREKDDRERGREREREEVE